MTDTLRFSAPFVFASVLAASAASAATGCLAQESLGTASRYYGGDAPAALGAAASGGGADGGAGALALAASTPSDCPAGTSDAPMRLTCTGLYANASLVTVAPGVEWFEPAHKLFSDDAKKARWIYLPEGARIDTSNIDEWVFPVGTKLWKEFALDGKRIETRFSWKVAADKWHFAVYRWADDPREAVRLDTGERLAIAGRTGAQRYEVPSRDKCAGCHNGRADHVLGFEAVGLGLPGAGGLTLDRLDRSALLTHPPAARAVTIPEDATGKAEAAIGWLHVNCGLSCHNANAGAGAAYKGMVLRLQFGELNSDSQLGAVTSLAAYRTTVGVAASSPPGGYSRIAKGNATMSAIPTLAGRRDEANPYGQMPPGLSHVVDENGLAALRTWIDAL